MTNSWELAWLDTDSFVCNCMYLKSHPFSLLYRPPRCTQQVRPADGGDQREYFTVHKANLIGHIEEDTRKTSLGFHIGDTWQNAIQSPVSWELLTYQSVRPAPTAGQQGLCLWSSRVVITFYEKWHKRQRQRKWEHLWVEPDQASQESLSTRNQFHKLFSFTGINLESKHLLSFLLLLDMQAESWEEREVNRVRILTFWRLLSGVTGFLRCSGVQPVKFILLPIPTAGEEKFASIRQDSSSWSEN